VNYDIPKIEVKSSGGIKVTSSIHEDSLDALRLSCKAYDSE